jgi:hypothetical protein
LLPMYLVGRWYPQALLCLALATAAATGLKHTWYDNLPPAE